MGENPCMSGDYASDAFKLLGVIIPHVINLVIALLTYRKVIRNSKRTRRIERALNGKVDSSEE